MLAAQILRETVDDIFADLRGSMICLMPMLASLLLMVVSIVMAVAAYVPVATDAAEAPLPGLWQVLALLGLALLVGIGWLWTAVAWHRMIVLGEAPGRVFPRWHGGNMAGYLGRGLLVGLLVGVATVPLVAVASMIAPNSVSPPGMGEGDSDTYTYVLGQSPTDFTVPGLLVWLVMTGVLYGLLLRLSVILPAGAVDRPLRLGEAWSLTAGRFLNLFVPLGILLALVVLAIGLIASVVSFGGVLDLFAMALQTLLGIGVLTRLYLYFTDAGRPGVDNPLPRTEPAAMPPE